MDFETREPILTIKEIEIRVKNIINQFILAHYMPTLHKYNAVYKIKKCFIVYFIMVNDIAGTKHGNIFWQTNYIIGLVNNHIIPKTEQHFNKA